MFHIQQDEISFLSIFVVVVVLNLTQSFLYSSFVDLKFNVWVVAFETVTNKNFGNLNFKRHNSTVSICSFERMKKKFIWNHFCFVFRFIWTLDSFTRFLILILRFFIIRLYSINSCCFVFDMYVYRKRLHAERPLFKQFKLNMYAYKKRIVGWLHTPLMKNAKNISILSFMWCINWPTAVSMTTTTTAAATATNSNQSKSNYCICSCSVYTNIKNTSDLQNMLCNYKLEVIDNAPRAK